MATLSQHELAVAIEACAYAAVTPKPTRHGVVMGEIAWDDCACGQLVVAEQRRFPAREFPLEEVDHSAECGEPWIVTQLLLSLTRCIPTVDANGVPPSIAALTAAALQNSTDMTVVRKAVMCCLTTLYDTHQLAAFELGSQEVTGPTGMCGGFDLLIFVGHLNDCGC